LAKVSLDAPEATPHGTARPRTARRGTVALLLAGLALAGCASKDDEGLTDAVPPDVLYNKALSSMNSGKTTQAIKDFEEVDRLHPYSELAKKSILLAAYSNFEKGAYTDAVQGAKRFLTLYASSPDAPYAQYLIAESYYRQIPEISRDQAMTKNALEAYTTLVEKYPNSGYQDDAKRKIGLTRDQLAGKEMEVGRYYLSKRQHLAAINRFKIVVADYQTSRHTEEALARLVECYYALGVITEAQTAAAVLGHNYPDSQWYKDSYSLLKSGGYEPSETESSWISKSFRGIKLI
jgi:outer membrane protein assembly factor BamD